MRKDINELIDICNKNSGQILSSIEVLNLFGYSPNNSIDKLAIRHLITREMYIHPALYWRLGSWAIITYEELTEYEQEVTRSWVMASIISENQYLYPRSKIPWWRLKEYGGDL